MPQTNKEDVSRIMEQYCHLLDKSEEDELLMTGNHWISRLPPGTPISRGIFEPGFFSKNGKVVKYRPNIWAGLKTLLWGYGFVNLILKFFVYLIIISAYRNNEWFTALVAFTLGFLDIIGTVWFTWRPPAEINLCKKIVYDGFSSNPSNFEDVDCIWIEEHTKKDLALGRGGIRVSLCSTRKSSIYQWILNFDTWQRDEIEIVKKALPGLLGKHLQVKYTISGQIHDYEKTFRK